MKILITGAAGVVGRAATRALETQHELILLDIKPVDSPHRSVQADLNDWAAIAERLAPLGPLDALAHLAFAPPHLHIPIEERTAQQIDISVRGTWVLLNALARQGLGKCVYASSMSVYGRPDIEMAAAGRYDETSDPWLAPNIDPYGMAKLLGENVVRYFAYSRGVPGLCLRLWAVHEPGVMERRGTHVDDVGAAFAQAMASDTGTFDCINILPDGNWLGISNRKAKELLGWKPQHTFEKRRDLEDWTVPG